jgi:hypothetical protein
MVGVVDGRLGIIPLPAALAVATHLAAPIFGVIGNASEKFAGACRLDDHHCAIAPLLYSCGVEGTGKNRR